MLLIVEEVMGAAEIGLLLGVSRQRVQQIIGRADFPAPATELAMGKIWLAKDVRAWIAEHRPTLAEAAETTPPKRTARTKLATAEGKPETRASKAMRANPTE